MFKMRAELQLIPWGRKQLTYSRCESNTVEIQDVDRRGEWPSFRREEREEELEKFYLGQS